MDNSAIKLTQDVICLLICIFDSPEPYIVNAIEEMEYKYGYEVERLRNLLSLLQKQRQLLYSIVGRDESAICRRLIELGMEFPNEILPRSCNHSKVDHRVTFNDLVGRMGIIAPVDPARKYDASLTQDDKDFLAEMRVKVSA